ncbi:MAG: hypothetical protein K5650_07585 [Bacteroidales bacterium]|nr:hypothetical protein [Bacteroidales bacterium]
MTKKSLILAMLVCGTLAVAAQEHVEFRWYGFYGVGEYAFMTNVNQTTHSDTANLHGFTFISGFQFGKEAGLGLGVTYLNDPRGGFTQLPVFLELRSHFSRNTLTPFSAVQIGYCIPLGATGIPPKSIYIDEGGLYFNILAGARYALSRNLAVNLNMGYQLMFLNKVKMCDENGMPALDDPILFHMLRFGAGVNF